MEPKELLRRAWLSHSKRPRLGLHVTVALVLPHTLLAKLGDPTLLDSLVLSAVLLLKEMVSFRRVGVSAHPAHPSPSPSLPMSTYVH